MSNTSTENEALIKDLMYKCDCLYRENSRLREKVSAQPLGVAEKEAYELQLSEKDTIIAKKEAKISKLEERVAYLERQLYGRKAEKFIKPDGWILKVLTCCRKKRKPLRKQKRSCKLPERRSSPVKRWQESVRSVILSLKIWNAGRSMFILKGIMKRNGFFFPERK